MSTPYLAANGQRITDKMIDRWCEVYERGEFPDDEHTVGKTVYGRPSLSDQSSDWYEKAIERSLTSSIRA